MNKDITNIPREIIEYIEKDEEKIIFRNNETRKFLCPKCLSELTKDFKCEKCCKNYQFENFLDYINHTAIKKEEGYLNENTYSYFYVIDNKPILYGINCDTLFMPNKKERNLSFDYIYEINENGVYDYVKEKQVYNSELTEEYIYCYSRKNNIFTTPVNLYLDNLDILKDTIYKNTNIWLDKDYLSSNNFKYLKLLNIIYAPIYYSDYNYLKEQGLKNLAYLKNFYEMDGTELIEKEILTKHLEFMKKIDIDYPRYLALKETKKEDVEFLDNYIEKVLYGEEVEED